MSGHPGRAGLPLPVSGKATPLGLQQGLAPPPSARASAGSPGLAEDIETLGGEVAALNAALLEEPQAPYPELRAGYVIVVDRTTRFLIEEVRPETVVVRQLGSSGTFEMPTKELFEHLDPLEPGIKRWRVKASAAKTAPDVPPRAAMLLERHSRVSMRLAELELRHALRTDPELKKALLIRQGLHQRRQELVTQIGATHEELRVWLEERDRFRPSRLAKAAVRHGLPHLAPGLSPGKPMPRTSWKDLVRDATDVEAEGEAPGRARLRALEARLRVVDKAVDNANRGRPLDEGLTGGRDYAVDVWAEFAESEALEPNMFAQVAGALDFAAKAAASNRPEDTIVACYAAAGQYLVLENADGESLLKTPDGRMSLTAKVNLAIQRGAVDNAHKPVLTAADLRAVFAKVVDAWPEIAGGSAQQGEAGVAHHGLFPLGERPGVEPVRAEIARLLKLENGVTHQRWRAELRQEGKSLADVHAAIDRLASPTAAERIGDLLSATLEIPNSSGFVGMVLVGAATGAAGSALFGESWFTTAALARALSSGRLSAKAVKLFLATSAVHGAAFHAGMNLFHLALGESPHVDWRALSFARTAATLALVHAAGARHMVRAARAMRLFGRQPTLRGLGGRIQEGLRHIGEQVGALSAVPVAEVAVRRGDFKQALDTLAHSARFCLATQAIHAVQVRRGGTPERGSVQALKLEQVYRQTEGKARLAPTRENVEAAVGAFADYAKAVHRLGEVGQIRLLLESGKEVIEIQRRYLSPATWQRARQATIEAVEHSELADKSAIAGMLRRAEGAFTDPRSGTLFVDETLRGTAKGRQVEQHELWHLALKGVSPAVWQQIVHASQTIPGLSNELQRAYGASVPLPLLVEEGLAWGMSQAPERLSGPMRAFLAHPAVHWLEQARRPVGGPHVQAAHALAPVAHAKRGRTDRSAQEVLIDAGLTGAEADAVLRHKSASADKCEEVVRFLVGIGVEHRAVGRAIARFPSLLGLSVEGNVRPTTRYLREEIGLNEAQIAKIVARQPSTLGNSVERKLGPVIGYLRKELRVGRTQLAKAIVRHPSILGLSVEGNMKPTVRYLQEEFGLNKTQVARLVGRQPSILTSSVQNKLVPIVSYLREDLGLTKAQLAKVVVGRPAILTRTLQDKLMPNVRYLQEEFLLSNEQLAKTIAREPGLLEYSVTGKLRPTVRCLSEEVGLSKAQLSKLVTRAPEVLGLSVEENLRPTIRCLREKFGLTKQELTKVVARFPNVLELSVEENLRPMLRYLEDEIGLDSEQLARVVVRQPSVLGSSVERNLRTKVRYLQDDLGLNADQVTQVVASCPSLLSCSVESNLKPTVGYLQKAFSLSQDQVTQAILDDPSVLTYSLRGRIGPRCAFLDARGIRRGVSRVLKPTDFVFAERVAHSSLPEYLEFREKWWVGWDAENKGSLE